ncbi:MAG: c-type cytochrome [Myxococcaceae bacterium]
MDLRGLPKQEVTRDDVQYRQKTRFRGVALSDVFAASPPPEAADLAILQFRNGMQVPVHPNDSAELSRLNAFIATEVWRPASEGQAEGWSTAFVPVGKAVAPGRDRRPIEFLGNKVMVETRWHPWVPERKDKKAFSPWAYVDSLVGIEYVQRAAYERQFRVTSGGDAVGYGLFRQSCQFCHGVAKVGAKFGWDFAAPIALSEYRGPRSLALHVKYREGDAPERGLMMPAFPEFKDADLEALWAWMSALGKQKPQPYRLTGVP